MFGKMILPFLGSSPSVWNTCMVFYQASLLLGYIYAHVSTRLLGVRKQAIFHVGFLLLPLLVLPIHIPNEWRPHVLENPIPGLLMLMVTSVGLPFFILSSTAPMLQKWFSSTKHIAAKDPYFLYVASNIGSMLALLGYPTIIEPNLKLKDQSNLWFYIYFLFIAFAITCVVMLWFSKPREVEEQKDDPKDRLSIKDKVKWVLYSFVPSSLMLGMTTYFSIDISPVPLIWVIPLAVYLLTFIFVFSKKSILPHDLMIKIMPYVVLGVLFYMFTMSSRNIVMVFSLHLLTLFVCAMVCHGELAKNRPSTKYLTEFYLWISIGGFLGGFFNSLIAPLIFKEVVEYPLAVVLACLLKPGTSFKGWNKKAFIEETIFSLIPAGVIVGLKYFLEYFQIINSYWLANVVMYGIPAIICLRSAFNSFRFGLSVGAIILVYMFYMNPGYYDVLYTERNFFGVHRISIDKQGKKLYLFQDTTLHGEQKTDELDKCVPLSYYHETGPIGQLFNAFADDNTKTHVAAIGLGTGSVSCLGKKNQKWIFYEIDPSIVRINNDAKYFTFLVNSLPETYVYFGDARLTLQGAKNNYYDFIILDAFSSDAIPIHLITREAMELYLKKLRKGGIIAFHISNRYLNLAPVLGNLAWYQGLVAVIQQDNANPYYDKSASNWVLIAREKSDLGKLVYDKRWQPLYGRTDLKLWTDDYSNIFSIFNW